MNREVVMDFLLHMLPYVCLTKQQAKEIAQTFVNGCKDPDAIEIAWTFCGMCGAHEELRKEIGLTETR